MPGYAHQNDQNEIANSKKQFWPDFRPILANFGILWSNFDPY